MLPKQDRERLFHMRDAARWVQQFVTGISEDEFLQSALVQHAVVNCLFIIGEAAARVTESTRDLYPHVEWDALRGMRNRLAHAYFDINLGIVWYSATTDIPELLAALEQILSSDG